MSTRYARVLLGGTAVYARDDGSWTVLDSAPWFGGKPTGARLPPTTPLLAPVQPSKIVAFARTYPKHAAELGNAPPAEPLLFLKPPSAIIGPGEAIRLPDVGRCDPEGEVALVIGHRLVDATAAQARQAVFGVTAVNDVSARALQKAEPTWSRAKGFDTFCPVGPVVVTGLDPRDLAVQTAVGGVVRAQGRTSEMSFDPYELVAWASRIMTLEPGDLISTGTPPGVDPIVPGDLVEVTVQGVGTLSNPVVAR